MLITEIGYTTPTSVVIRGQDFSTQILGKMDFLDIIMLTSVGRTPTPQEKVMLNLIMVTAAGHGITPSVIAARMTLLGAPEALQGAVAAGILGGGSVYLGPIQNIAQTLLDISAQLTRDASDDEVRAAAQAHISAMAAQKKPVWGVGSATHQAGDPRVPTMRELARDNGFYGLHWRVLDAIGELLSEQKGRPFCANGAGALAAIVADMGISPALGRGLMLTGRCASLIAQLLEEQQTPIAQEMWDLVLKQDPRCGK
ncbi:citryl-CoA lyase [Diaphorobacter caeni]|uniref:citryl-CoA lyase n=1 Tax=Diaphorobacter caeni TaxID=2784387 RepID=UPI00188FED78|nr:citryl-CoA lyase [Diaphorobacter caeni]MBF5007297.1 citryl-CoA lyase [Diaphorobacter caeni]